MESNIPDLLNRISKYMLDYIADEQDGAYTNKDVAACMNILHAYLAEVAEATNTKTGMQTVKAAVLKLNELNERCEHELIETDQREDIAELMQAAFLQKAFAIPPSGDITEEWREW